MTPLSVSLAAEAGRSVTSSRPPRISRSATAAEINRVAASPISAFRRNDCFVTWRLLGLRSGKALVMSTRSQVTMTS